MPDTKITALTALTAADPANDVLPIVDVSDTTMAASGTTKKISINNVLGCSGTATLASATITGNLTVDTNTFFVDSANNRVGVGTATPDSLLQMSGAGTINWKLSNTSDSVTVGAYAGTTTGTTGTVSNHPFFLFTNNTERYRLASDGVATWSNVGGVAGTAMTLNATGLGVGASPSTRLHIQNTGDVYARIATTSVSKAGVQLSANGVVRSHLLYDDGAGTTYLTTGTSFGGSGQALVAHSGTSFQIYTNNQLATAQMTLDASGNLLVGTTAPLAGNAAKFHLSTNSGTTRWAVGPYSDPNSFIISAVGGSGVYLNGTAATSWTSASDERLKDIIEPISNAVAKVGSLRAVIGKFKFDQNNTRKPFLIAQDIQAVLPEAVDASNPDQLGVAYTEVIPLLVAAIKELTARVQTLETR